jgi:hypothetical protein
MFKIMSRPKATPPGVDFFHPIVKDDPDVLDCFVHLPDQHSVPFQMGYPTIAETQERDAVLLKESRAKQQLVQRKLPSPGIHVYCRLSTPGGPWNITFLAICFEMW